MILQHIKQITFSKTKTKVEYKRSSVYIRIQPNKFHKNNVKLQSFQNVKEEVFNENFKNIFKLKLSNRLRNVKNICQTRTDNYFYNIFKILPDATPYFKKKAKARNSSTSSERCKEYTHKAMYSNNYKSNKTKFFSRVSKRSTSNEILNQNTHSQHMTNKHFGPNNLPHLTPVTGESTKGSAQVMLNSGKIE